MVKYLREIVPLIEGDLGDLWGKSPSSITPKKAPVKPPVEAPKGFGASEIKSERPSMGHPIKRFLYDRSKRKEAHEKADAARGKVNWGSVGAGALAGGPVGAAVMYSYEKHWKKPK